MPQPPKTVSNLLSRLCPNYLWESIAGDLEEQFMADNQELGLGAARRRYAWNALLFIRPGILLRNKLKINNTIMITNYLKTAGRNMAKRKLFTFINAFGLSVAIAFCILIYLFVKDEQSFDKLHSNAKDIYRVEEYAWRTFQTESKDPYMQSAYLQLALAPTLKEELSEVKFATRFNGGWSQVVKYQNKIFIEDIAFTDNDFFKMFSFPVLEGNSELFLLEPKQAVVTKSIAKKYFGDESPLNKILAVDIRGEQDYEIVGVMDDPPTNSSFNFDILIPQENRLYYERNMVNWSSFNSPTFVQLHEGSSEQQLLTSLIDVRDRYMKENMERDKEEYDIPEDAIQFEYRTSNLLDIHLNPDVNWHKVSDPQYSLILGGLAILIIVIASINYISLALTTSASRRLEVGVRKSIGATQKQLIYQFSFESVALAILSMAFGVIIMILFLPTFNDFTGKGIRLDSGVWLELLGFSLAISLLVGHLAGCYPAFYLSAFKPSTVLKGGARKVKPGLAKPLVFVQFMFSSALIVSALVMYEQMNYVTTKDLGFDKEQILVVPTQYGWTDESNAAVAQMRNALQSNPDIIDVGGVSSSFNRGWSRYGYTINEENKAAYVWAVDPNYIPAIGIEIVEGRNFDLTNASDSAALIVNEALVADMGWEDPLQEHLNWREDSIGPGYKVIGVAKDYHFVSLHRNIEPMFLSMNKNDAGHLTTMLIKMRPGDISQTISEIEATYKELLQDKPFEYTFLDEDVDSQYASFEQWMKIMSLSTLFAILISGLGLFGLAGINAVNRTKEIGIRKVFGAPLLNIFVMLNKQFIWMAAIAFVIAAPLGAYLINEWWLSDFEFKIELGWKVFALTFIAGLLVTIITVTYHGFRAAQLNPAETLKYE